MRYIDKDMAIKLIDKGWISDSDGIESIDEEEVISIDWLHKHLIEAMYERKLSSEVLAVFHELIAKWREENEADD